MKTIVMLLTIGSMALYAQTFNVSTTPEFRTALQNAAQNGEDDTIILADGTYTTTDDGLGTFIYVDTEIYDLTLTGSSAQNVILDGDNTDQIFQFLSDREAQLNIEKLSFINGKAGLITNNNAIGNLGGAIYVSSSINVENSIFINNRAATGGGIYTQWDINIISTSFIQNTALEGGGGFIASAVTVNDSNFTGNIGISNKDGIHFDLADGGGFYASNNAIVKRCNFNNNNASNGAGFFAQYSSYVEDSNFTENHTATGENYTLGTGGGFYVKAGVDIKNSQFLKNVATYGAGFTSGGYYNSKPTIISKSTFKDNNATVRFNNDHYGKQGYGAAFSTDILVLNDSIVQNNYSDGSEGSAITILKKAVITNTVFQNNTGISTIEAGSIDLSNTFLIDNDSGIRIKDVTNLNNLEDPNIVVNSVFINNSSNSVNKDIFGNIDAIANIKNNYINNVNILDIKAIKASNIYDNVTLGFVDEANGDYNLTASSDLIDAGTNDYADKFIVDGVNYLATDFAENNRSVGASMDIGIYEYSTTKPTIIDFTFTGEAKEYQELTFDVSYHLTDGRTVQSVEYDYMNDGNFVTTDTHTYNEAKTYTVHARVTDDVGEYSLRTIRVQIEQLAYEDMTDEQKLKEAVDPQYYDDIQGIIDTAIADAEQSGQQYVIDNPSDFNLGDINEIEVRCRMNPQSCGITPKVVVIPL